MITKNSRIFSETYLLTIFFAIMISIPSFIPGITQVDVGIFDCKKVKEEFYKGTGLYSKHFSPTVLLLPFIIPFALIVNNLQKKQKHKKF